MSTWEAIEVIRLPGRVVNETMTFLRSRGEDACEGVVLWVGHLGHAEYHLLHAVVPKQTPIITNDGVGYFVDGTELHRLNLWLRENGLTLLAQVHSHPGEAYHSDTDDRWAVVTKLGGLSLVVPDFAREPFDLERLAAYRLTRAGWQAIPPAQLTTLISLEE